MLFDTNKEKGNSGIGLDIAYFTTNGYIVSIPLNDTQDYDLIVHHVNIEERDIGEWDDDNPLNLLDCPKSECEKYFE